MDAKPDAFPAAFTEADDHGWTEEELDLFERCAEAMGDFDEEVRARRDAEAMADIAAGRVVPHAMAVEWFRSLGTANPLPMPQPWLK